MQFLVNYEHTYLPKHTIILTQAIGKDIDFRLGIKIYRLGIDFSPQVSEYY